MTSLSILMDAMPGVRYTAVRSKETVSSYSFLIKRLKRNVTTPLINPLRGNTTCYMTLPPETGNCILFHFQISGL